MLSEGQSIQMNKSLAIRYFKLSADRENTRGLLYYASVLHHSEGFMRNKSLVAHYFKFSADQKNAEAQFHSTNHSPSFCTNPFPPLPPLSFRHAVFFIFPISISIPFLRFGYLVGAVRSCLLCDSIPMFMRFDSQVYAIR
jgi:TPR repeat protein